MPRSSPSRSQHRNKALAVARLHEALAAQEAVAVRAVEQTKWSGHNTVTRGDSVRVFVGEKFVERT